MLTAFVWSPLCRRVWDLEDDRLVVASYETSVLLFSYMFIEWHSYLSPACPSLPSTEGTVMCFGGLRSRTWYQQDTVTIWVGLFENLAIIDCTGLGGKADCVLSTSSSSNGSSEPYPEGSWGGGGTYGASILRWQEGRRRLLPGYW